MFNLIEKKFEDLENKSITENGAVGYKSTGSALLDLNYSVSSLRQASEDEIIRLFDFAFNEDKVYAMKWLFFARDVRGGLGERRLFRICYQRLVDLDIDYFMKNLINISEYGRWDDLVSLLGISSVTDERIITIIKSQLKQDLYNYDNGNNVSLLAKWLPSENASSVHTKRFAKNIRKLLGLSSKKYRKMLSLLRKYLDVVEVKMCSNEWEDIDYNKVPSLANLKYRNAFLKHDKFRRLEYLDDLCNNKAKMNMSVGTPVDIVSNYCDNWYGVKEYDKTLELAWDNLKDINVSDTLVVADGSGSMTVSVSRTNTALEVANALAIYTSEHNSSVYKNKYITFSNTPQFVKFDDDDSLKEKLEICLNHSEVANTNIEAVFKLILEVAIENELSNDDMIKNILIISDMEFDMAQRGWSNSNVLTKPLFESIKEDYANAGYLLPKLIFWNVNSRTKTIPLIENDLGVTLVSGFSQNVLKMVMSDKYDPYDVLKEQLDSERYDNIFI